MQVLGGRNNVGKIHCIQVLLHHLLPSGELSLRGFYLNKYRDNYELMLLLLAIIFEQKIL